AEYAMSSQMNYFDFKDSLAPGLKVGTELKRYKNSNSPIFTLNDRLKTEFIVYPDVIDEQGNVVTDAGMYILPEQAEMLRKAGRGIYDFNNGYKLLNYSIETENPNFMNKTSLVKGYTTVLTKEMVYGDENNPPQHPELAGLYETMVRRLNNYKKWHKRKYG